MSGPPSGLWMSHAPGPQEDDLGARGLHRRCPCLPPPGPLGGGTKNHFSGARAAVIEERLCPVSLARCGPPAAPRGICGGRKRRRKGPCGERLVDNDAGVRGNNVLCISA